MLGRSTLADDDPESRCDLLKENDCIGSMDVILSCVRSAVEVVFQFQKAETPTHQVFYEPFISIFYVFDTLLFPIDYFA